MVDREGGVMDQSGWERQILEKMVFALMDEQKRQRSWRLVRRVVLLLIVLLGGALAVGQKMAHQTLGSHTALINVEGEIGGQDVRADNVVSSLQDAFADTDTKGVILRLNSPGGSPVQAGIIHDEVIRLRKLHPGIPIYAVVEDICASGGYYVAVSADKIYVDKASLVGSIGVVMDGFGYTGLMQKLGVERRVLVAGKNKALLDPFAPVNPAQKTYVESLLGEIHQQFISVVRAGRGKRLSNNTDLFSGLVWTGEQSVRLGLADALGSVDFVAREVIKEPNVVDVTHQDDWEDRFIRRFSSAMARQVVSQRGSWHAH